MFKVQGRQAWKGAAMKIAKFEDMNTKQVMSSRIILIGLIVLIVCAPLAVGSVYIVTYSAMELLVFSLLLLHVWATDFSRLKVRRFSLSALSSSQPSPTSRSASLTLASVQSSYVRRTLWLLSPLFLFLLFSLFQMVPLPFSFLEKLSANTAVLYSRLGFPLDSKLVAPPWLPLTLSLSATSIAILKWSAYASVFFLAATSIPQDADVIKWVRALFIAIFIIGLAEAVYGLYNYLNQSEYLLWFTKKYYKDSVTGTYVNRNHFAGLMNVCILVSVSLFVSHIGLRTRAHRFRTAFVNIFSSEKSLLMYFLFLGLIVMVLALIFSMSRMAQFSLIVAITFVALLYLASAIIRRAARSRLLPLVLFLVLGLGFLWGAWKGLGPVEDRWQALGAGYEDRALMWQTTQKLISNFPFTGTGLGTYELAYPPYKPQKYGALIIDHAHNDYLELLSEVGLIGFIPWAGFFLLFIIFSIHAWLKRRNPFSRFVGPCSLAATVAILVHSLADFNLQIPANAMLLFLIMGLTWRLVNTSFETRSSER